MTTEEKRDMEKINNLLSEAAKLMMLHGIIKESDMSVWVVSSMTGEHVWNVQLSHIKLP